jgi:uncharacterized repeat protein (TIGR03803 family)
MKTQQTSIANRHSQYAWTFSAVTAPLMLLLLLAVSTAQAAQAPTFHQLYSFSGEADGEYPFAAVTIGPRGKLYGTTTRFNGGNGYGLVYELQNRGSGWTINVLHAFQGLDGIYPFAGVVFGADGVLYGSTSSTVYALRPLTAHCGTVTCPWHIDVLQRFAGGLGYGDVAFDNAGNIYGTSLDGGANRDGSAFELSHSGLHWTTTTLYSFAGGPSDGEIPYGGVIFDAAGNMYGTTSIGGENDWGIIYKLTPTDQGWSESVLYNFDNDVSGAAPYSTLAMDSSGNLYGTTVFGGVGGAGTVFELSPSGGSWTFTVLYNFTDCTTYSGLTIDSSGTLYGTCPHGGGHEAGFVYTLSNSDGSWTFTDLYDFTGGTGGYSPGGGVVLDGSGNLFGTTEFGGTSDAGTVWELTDVASRHSQVKEP